MGWQDASLKNLQMESVTRRRSARIKTMNSVRRLLAILFLGATCVAPSAGWSAEPVRLEELVEVLKSNLAGATLENLNRAAVAGLLDQLSPRVRLLDDNASER